MPARSEVLAAPTCGTQRCWQHPHARHRGVVSTHTRDSRVSPRRRVGVPNRQNKKSLFQFNKARANAETSDRPSRGIIARLTGCAYRALYLFKINHFSIWDKSWWSREISRNSKQRNDNLRGQRPRVANRAAHAHCLWSESQHRWRA